jgi:lysophospholipase L1-like esterase
MPTTAERLRLAVALVLALGAGVAAGWNVAPPQGASTGAAPAPSWLQPAASASQRRVALYGDGLIDGYGLPDAQSLPVLLAGARPDLLVVDLGMGHETSDKLPLRVRDATEAHLDSVVVWGGSYDAAAGVTPDQYATNMGALLDAFKGLRVILLPPIALQAGGNIAPYRAALDRVAAQRALKVSPVDSALAGADWQDGGQDLGPKVDTALATLVGGLL